MEISSEGNGNKFVFTTEPYSSNGMININANNNLKIRGNIGVGYLGNFVGGSLSATKNSRININNSSNGTVQIEGDIYTANILNAGIEYRDNNIDVIMQDENSYLKGRVITIT